MAALIRALDLCPLMYDEAIFFERIKKYGGFYKDENLGRIARLAKKYLCNVLRDNNNVMAVLTLDTKKILQKMENCGPELKNEYVLMLPRTYLRDFELLNLSEKNELHAEQIAFQISDSYLRSMALFFLFRKCLGQDNLIRAQSIAPYISDEELKSYAFDDIMEYLMEKDSSALV